jgi:hypothetical protein
MLRVGCSVIDRPYRAVCAPMCAVMRDSRGTGCRRCRIGGQDRPGVVEDSVGDGWREGSVLDDQA